MKINELISMDCQYILSHCPLKDLHNEGVDTSSLANENHIALIICLL